MIKSKAFLILTALLSYSNLIYAQVNIDKSKYLGLQYQGAVVGEKVQDLIEMGGGLIAGLLPSETVLVGVSQKSKGSSRMLWLEKSTGNDPKGIPLWQVKDVLVFTAFEKNQSLHFAGDPTCTRNGKQELSLIVLTDSSPPSPALKILKAWTANAKTEKFEELPATTGIKCEAFTP